MKKLLVLLLILVACSPKKDITQVKTNYIESLLQDDYRITTEKSIKSTRDVHRERNRAVNKIAIKKGLLDISKMYFPTSQYLLNEIDILSYDRLTKHNQYSFDDIALLNYNSAENPYGLNPQKTEKMIVNKQEIVGPILIKDLIELDFTLEKDNELGAIVTALVLSKKPYTQNKQTIEVPQDQLVRFGQEASNKLNVFFSTLPQLSTIPKVVALFVEESEDSNIPGRFVGYTLYSEGKSKYHAFDESYYYLGSDTANKKNSELNSVYNLFKSELNALIYENVSVVGLVRTVNDEIVDVELSVSAQFKTYMDEEVILSKIKSFSNQFKNETYDLTITVKDVNEVKAIFNKLRKQTNITVTRR